MPSTEPAILRALQGLADRSGRTVVVIGPPGSGKSALLAELGAAVEAAGGRTVSLRGSYRDRGVPFAALEGLDRPATGAEEDVPAEDGGPVDGRTFAPMAPVALDPQSIPSSRRRDGRVRTTLFGGAARGRGPPTRDADDYWRQLRPEFQGDEAHPVALLLDDGAFFDPESREFVVDLSRRARLRPLLLAVALDSTASTAAAWEEALLGRADVDWVRLHRPAPDPREVHRLRGLLDDLGGPATRALGYVVLLGGEASEVVLARISKLSLAQARETIRPAAELGLLRDRDGRIAVPDRSSLPILEGLLPASSRDRWHLDIAEGLQALSAEPPLSRRIEIARHYLAAAPDLVAMARLYEAAEVSLGLLEFDEATRLMVEAIRCLTSTPVADRPAIEPEMRFTFARALIYAGCAAEAERELREGIDGALRAGTSAADLAGWIEPLLPALQVVGPRRQLATTVVELAERLDDAGLVEPEVLLESLSPAYDVERELAERARSAALRAAQHAQRTKERYLQALGLFAIGVAGVAGGPEETVQAERFLRASRLMLRAARRWELDYVAAEFECRALERRGLVDQAMAVRLQNISALERARLPSVEILHDLAVAEVLLDGGTPSRADGPLDRALRLADNLHLVPPSPGLLRAWLLDGRRYALAGSVSAARDRWSALIDLPSTHSLPRLRAEAFLRLALLESAAGREEEAERLAVALTTPDLASSLPAGWRQVAQALASRAPTSQHGGGPLPRAADGALPGSKPERRDRRRRAPPR